jgi:hypothetical protein
MNKALIHPKAQSMTMQYLRDKYRTEYTAKYREFVVQLGGGVRPTKEERIAKLKEQIAQLEASHE